MASVWNTTLTKTQRRSLPLTIRDGLIDERRHSCVVDFANKHVGGHYLTGGFVQEEKLVWERTDLAALLTKGYVDKCPYTMGPREAWVFRGLCKWASCQMYGTIPADWRSRTHVYPGPGTTTTTSTSTTHPLAILAMDALPHRSPDTPYSRPHLQWLVTKAYIGFRAARGEGYRTIATGNWGCGMFGNRPEVMLWVQCLGAMMAGVRLVYYGAGVDLGGAVEGMVGWVGKGGTFGEVVGRMGNGWGGDREGDSK